MKTFSQRKKILTGHRSVATRFLLLINYAHCMREYSLPARKVDAGSAFAKRIFAGKELLLCRVSLRPNAFPKDVPLSKGLQGARVSGA